MTRVWKTLMVVPSPPENTPFPVLNLKLGKMNYPGPQLGKMFEKWEFFFLEVGKKKLFIGCANSSGKIGGGVVGGGNNDGGEIGGGNNGCGGVRLGVDL